MGLVGLVGACSLFKAGSGDAGLDASRRQHCHTQIPAVTESCRKANPDWPPQVASVSNHADQLSSCTDEESQALLSTLHSCIADLKDRARQKDAEARKRMAKVADKVPEIKADAAYQQLKRDFDSLSLEVEQACTEAKYTYDERRPGASTAERLCDLKRQHLGETRRKLGTLFESYGVQPGDARDLGLL